MAKSKEKKKKGSETQAEIRDVFVSEMDGQAALEMGENHSCFCGSRCSNRCRFVLAEYLYAVNRA